MDTGKDIEATSTTAPPAGETEAIGSAPAGETPAAGQRIETAQTETSKPAGAPTASPGEEPQAASRDEIKLVRFDDEAARRSDMPSSAPAAEALPRASRFALLAATMALAAAFGAVAGAVGMSGLTQMGETSTPAVATAAPETPAIQGALAQMRSDIAALKSSVETATRATNGQSAKISERFDRVERAQTERAAKLTKVTETLERLERRADAAQAKEATASVPAAQPAATPPQPPVVDGWVVRDVYRGMAVIQGRRLGMVEVEPGDTVPGIGRIESIKKQDGRWVVVTSKGLITSATR